MTGCRVDGCGNSLDGGEGWNGYCGSHADLIHAHDEGDHGTGAGTDTTDATSRCPLCIEERTS